MLQSFFIPGWHPAPLNKLIGNPFSANRLKKHDKEQISRAMLVYNLVPAKQKRIVDLTMIVAKGQRTVDPDATAKSLNDALVSCGLLCNDSLHWVVNKPVQYARAITDAAVGSVVILEDA